MRSFLSEKNQRVRFVAVLKKSLILVRFFDKEKELSVLNLQKS